ncbi:uncharacterized protein [Littorina saxatilis]|uniref:uncharacterized protein isoform X1 n=1 Tax=Littorina saxatilis TaxID=31220 RepID=UPI0038B47D13
MEGEEREGQAQAPGEGGEEASSAAAETQPAATQGTDSDNEQKIKLDEESQEKPASQKVGSEAEEGSPAEEGAGISARKTPDGIGSSRPHSSASGARVKSSASGEIVFEAKKKKSKRGDSAAPDDAYTVTFTVSIAVAIPTEDYVYAFVTSSVEDEDQPDLKDLLKKKKRVFEAPRAQNYYHVEYYLIPGEDELMKTDIVTYGMAAKLYMERHDARVIKTWQDGELTWIAWAHSHSMTVTKEMLLKLYNHTLELRVWDTKDKCSTRARFDRPKAFRLPQPKPGESSEDVGGVKAMVTKQLAGFSKMQSPKGNAMRPLPQRCAYPRADTKKRAPTAVTPGAPTQSNPDFAKGTKTLVAVPNKAATGQQGRTFSRLGRLAGAERPTQSAGASALKDMVVHENSATARRHQKKAEAAAAAAVENTKKFGVCVVPFRMALLFSGSQSITSRLEQPVSGVEDLFITVSLDLPLMSDELKQELNPMIITVKSVTDLPNSPMSIEELKSKCQPVYCKYQFFKQPMHTTVAKEHDRNIYWDDKNVVLLGPQEPSELREYLSGPAMQVEVHDRDRKAEDVTLKGTLFGDDLEDEKISNVGTVASRRTLHNPFHGRNKPWDPYGVCHVDLSELLLGHRFLELKIPVHNCPLPDVLGVEGGRDSRLVGVAGAVDGPVDKPLPAGKYMQTGAALKIQVELAYPIITPAKLATKEELESTPECPFGRIIFVFAYNNTTMLHRLQGLVTEINALALELDDMSQHVIDAALSTYKLSIEQQTSGTLDIVTGFHVLDGEKHIFVLEGLRDKAIERLWDELPRPENSDVRVMYNSDFSFSKRLYGPLDVDLCRVKLHEPLRLVVAQSLLYVRDMVPKPCFLALTRLEEMTRLHLMKDVVKNNIFLNSDMVVSMSKEFGVPFTAEDFEELRPDWERSPLLTRDEAITETPMVMLQTSRDWTPIDSFNKDFVDSMVERQEKGSSHDFIGENKDQVKRESDMNLFLRSQTRMPLVQADVVKTHNYSTQTLNSTELANEALRAKLQEQPDTRFTRCQEFLHSSTIVPVNLEALAKEEAEASRKLWRSPSGWIYPGKRSMVESNAHPNKPHPARIDELQEEWRENILHVRELQPPLERDRFPWDYRRHDMELYIKPPPEFIKPLSIHLPGVKLQAEKMEAKEREMALWKSQVVVDDTEQYFHRLLPKTEMTDAGFYSSNQIDRLTSLLKDPPNKFSLKQTNVRDIPPLSVVNYPSVDTLARAQGLPLPPAIPEEGQERVDGYKPGPFDLSSWSIEDNRVPAQVYDHRVHAAKHGQDFTLVHKDRQRLWKKSIVPLNEQERDNHLFRTPMAFSLYQPLPAVGAARETLDPRDFLPRVDVATSTQGLAQSASVTAVHERGLVYV